MNITEEVKSLKRIAKARSVPKRKIKRGIAFFYRTRLFLHMSESIPVEDIKTTKRLSCEKGVLLTSNPDRAALRQLTAIMVDPPPSPALVEDVDHLTEKNVFVSKARLRFVTINIHEALKMSGGG